jgi:hypothetical protein
MGNFRTSISPFSQLAPMMMAQRKVRKPKIETVMMEVGAARILVPVPVCSYTGPSSAFEEKNWAARDEQLLLAAELQQKSELMRMAEPKMTVPVPAPIALAMDEVLTDDSGESFDRIVLKRNGDFDANNNFSKAD